MEEILEKAGESKPQRNEKGQLLPGSSNNLEGRKPDTEEKKLEKKVLKELVKDYKEKLAQSLVKIEPVLVAQAEKGNIQAIKEINDRVMGKPESKDNLPPIAVVPILVKFVDKKDEDNQDTQ